MFDHAPFIAAVVERPFDDGPRLIYAEVLDEAGEYERADFIRTQLDIAGQRDPVRRPRASPENDRVQDALQQREWELFKDSGPAWWDELPGSYRATAVDARLADVRIETAEGWRYIVRRGFPEELTITVEALVGAPCRRCDGSGMAEMRDDGNHGVSFTRRCSACRGSGTLPGIAAELFRLAPITVVRLTGKKPERPPTGAPEASWYNEELAVGDRVPMLPYSLFGRLVGGEYSEGCRTYPAVNVAEEALSRACVDYGRAEAGLPPLAWPPLPKPRAVRQRRG